MESASLRMSNGDRAAIHNEISRLQVGDMQISRLQVGDMQISRLQVGDMQISRLQVGDMQIMFTCGQQVEV